MSGQRQVAAALAATVVALAGCGGPAGRARAVRQTTVPAYAGFRPDTISVSSRAPDSPACRLDARAFARYSLVFLAHSGPQSAAPPDTYYLVMREDLADFTARRCRPALLGSALDRRLTARRRSALLADLPGEMDDVLREALSSAGS